MAVAEDMVAVADQCRAPVDAVECSAPEEAVVIIWIDLEGVWAEKEVRAAVEEEDEVGVPEVEVDEDLHGGKWILLDTNVCIILIINWIESK